MRFGPLFLLLLITLVYGLVAIEPQKPVAAQISPSIPEFSLKIQDYSYDVQPTYTSDPYTGKTVMQNEGYRVDRRFVAVVIQNPDSPSFYAVVNSSVVKLYYHIRIKGHTQDWSNATVTEKNLAPLEDNYTTVKFGLGNVNPDPEGWSIWIGEAVSGENQIDVQVQGINGYYTNRTAQEPPCWRIEELSLFHETGRSDWSATQTITLGGEANPTSTAEGSGRFSVDSILLVLAIITAVILAVFVVALVYPEKAKREHKALT